jgi:hypothetical protein
MKFTIESVIEVALNWTLKFMNSKNRLEEMVAPVDVELRYDLEINEMVEYVKIKEGVRFCECFTPTMLYVYEDGSLRFLCETAYLRFEERIHIKDSEIPKLVQLFHLFINAIMSQSEITAEKINEVRKLKIEKKNYNSFGFYHLRDVVEFKKRLERIFSKTQIIEKSNDKAERIAL